MAGESLADRKNNLRKQIGYWRDKLSKDDRLVKSTEICHRLCHLIEHGIMQSAHNSTKPLTILSYLPFRSEVDVTPFLQWCWQHGQQVVVPKTDVRKKRMTLHIISGLHETELGHYGIREPHADQPVVSIADIDVILMPGLAFDEAGNRLGYGGGYYDRLLAYMSQQVARMPLLVAPCFEQQIVDVVPSEVHDFRINVLVTEKRIVHISNRC